METRTLSPVILFVFNRPEHTRRALESLSCNELANQSKLYVFCDGPKRDASDEERKRIALTREIVREKKWCGSVEIFESSNNRGLADSVIAGITQVMEKHGRAIVLEDDLVLSKKFLNYMNEALDRYEKEDRVLQISGFMFPVELKDFGSDAFFLPFISSWGWATWKRGWEFFDKDMKGLKCLEKNPELRKKFDLDGGYPYYKMLLKQKLGRIDSWAIRFYLGVFLGGGRVLYPRKTFVRNIGFDGSGVHCKNDIVQGAIDENFEVIRYPLLGENRDLQRIVADHLRKENGIIHKALNKLKSIFL